MLFMLFSFFMQYHMWSVNATKMLGPCLKIAYLREDLVPTFYIRPEAYYYV